MANHCSIGIDWSNGAWLGVVYQNDEYTEVLLKESVAEICRRYDEPVDQILVDMPIGLFEEGDRQGDEELVRECDRLARKVLGQRHSSVFNPPARDVVEQAVQGNSYEDLTVKNKEITGKGLQQQAYYISEGIYELDCLLRDDEIETGSEWTDVIAEAHPEVYFTAFADDQLHHSKHSVAGLVERLTALKQSERNPKEIFFEICSDIASKAMTDVDIDDVLDAMALALTATETLDELWRLPPGDDPPTDSEGLPMAMVYRGEQPFAGVDKNTEET